MFSGRQLHRRWKRWISALRALLVPAGGRPSRGAAQFSAGRRAVEPVFVGRGQLIDQVLRTVPNNSLFLSGEPGIGKTALLHEIEKHLPQAHDQTWDFFPVPASLEGVLEDRFFSCLSEGVHRALATQLGGERWMPHPQGGEGIDHRAFVHELRQVVHLLDRRTGKRVKLVFLVDEIDQLNHFNPLVNQRLRSLFMTGLGESLVAVVAGVRINRTWGREGSPWFNFFEEIEVGPLQPGEAVQLISALSRRRIDLEQGVIDRILELSGGRPRLLVGLCERLIAAVTEDGRRHPNLRDLDEAACYVGERQDESG